MTVYNEPRFKTYGVYDAHSGELVSKHETRREAVAAKALDHHLRVRGVPGEKQRERRSVWGWLTRKKAGLR